MEIGQRYKTQSDDSDISEHSDESDTDFDLDESDSDNDDYIPFS